MKKALFHGDVIDGTGAPLMENAAVVVEDNTIAALGPENEILPVRDRFEGELIDAQGWTVLPGLMDMHFHLSSVPPWRESYKIKQCPIPVITMTPGQGIVTQAFQRRSSRRGRCPERRPGRPRRTG